MKKIGKAEARYQSYPKGTKKCAGCTMFVQPDACTLVRGLIEPHGWCRYHEDKR